MTTNRQLFAPVSALMCKVYDAPSSLFSDVIEYYTMRGWRFVGAVTVCNDAADNGAGDWEGSNRTTFIYFE